MFIPIWFFLVLGLLGFIFITPYRQGVINFFATVWNVISGAFITLWNFITGHGPVIGAAAGATVVVIRYVAAVILIFALLGILFVAFLYFIVAGAIMTMGFATGHWGAALLLLASLLIWGMFSFVPYVRGLRPLVWFRRIIVVPLVLILAIYLVGCTGWWIFGNISPDTQESAARSAKNKVQEFNNRLDKSSLKSEAESGIFARVMEDVQGVNQDGEPTNFVQKDKLVKLAGLVGSSQNRDHEGMVAVMVPNRYGNFVAGDECYIPSRVIDWDWKKEKKEMTEEKTKAKKNQEKNPIAVVAKSNNGFANGFGGGKTLQSGQYCQEPSGQTKFLMNNESSPIELGDGKNITVPSGKEVVAVKTEHQLVSIYKGACD